MKIHPVRAELLLAGGRVDGHEDKSLVEILRTRLTTPSGLNYCSCKSLNCERKMSMSV